MTKPPPSSKTKSLKGRIKNLSRLIFIGLGLGVITGSLIKTFPLKGGDASSLRRQWPSIKELTKSAIYDFRNLGKSSKSYSKSQSSLKEIVILSNRWKTLAGRQKDLEASAYLHLIDHGLFAELKPNTILPAASSIKIAILLATLEKVDSGDLRWNENLMLTKDVIGGGAGWMGYQPLGKSFPTHEVATEMIRVSDNTATNILIKRIGGKEYLNERFKSLGLKSTQINNLLPDLDGTNKTSALDLAKTLVLAERGELLSQRSRDLFKETMNTSTTNRLLPEGLLNGLGISSRGNIDYNLMIKGYRVYNKTGDIGIAYADAGLIQLPDNTRAVAGFIVKGPFNDPRSPELIRQMASAMTSFIEPLK